MTGRRAGRTVAAAFVTLGGNRELARWTVHEERVVDDTRHVQVCVATVELPDFENLPCLGEGAVQTGTRVDGNETARVEWLALDTIRERIDRGEIMGAAAQIALLRVLAR